jgi:hypothetical protein
MKKVESVGYRRLLFFTTIKQAPEFTPGFLVGSVFLIFYIFLCCPTFFMYYVSLRSEFCVAISA